MENLGISQGDNMAIKPKTAVDNTVPFSNKQYIVFLDIIAVVS